MHKILIEECERAGFFPNVVSVSNDRDCYERLLCAGVGAGIGWDEPESDLSSLIYLGLCDFDRTYPIFCYYKKESCCGTVKSFLDFLKMMAR